MPVIFGTKDRAKAWRDVFTKTMNLFGERLGEAERALQEKLPKPPLPLKTIIGALPSKEAAGKLGEVVEGAVPAMETAEMLAAPQVGLLKTKAIVTEAAKPHLRQATRAIRKGVSKKTPGGVAQRRGIAKGLLDPEMEIIHEELPGQVTGYYHLGRKKIAVDPRRRDPTRTMIHELGHMGWKDLGAAQKASFGKAMETGHIPLDEGIKRAPKTYLKQSWDRVMDENYQRWSTKYFKGELSPTAEVDRNVIEWFQAQLGPANPWYGEATQKAFEKSKAGKGFFVK